MQTPTKVLGRSAVGGSGDPVAILAFLGDIASTSKDGILEAYATIDGSVHTVLLDFKGADYINSSGIAFIIQLLLEATQGRPPQFGDIRPDTALHKGVHDGGRSEVRFDLRG